MPGMRQCTLWSQGQEVLLPRLQEQLQQQKDTEGKAVQGGGYKQTLQES